MCGFINVMTQVRSSKMSHMSALFAVGLLLLIHSTEAFQIPECGPDGYVNVTEFKETKLISCQGLSQDENADILWLMFQDVRETQIASCTRFSCNILDNNGNFILTPSSVSNSVQLTIKQSHRQMNGATLRCSNFRGVWSEPAECKLRVIYGPSSAIISGPQHIIVNRSRTAVLTCSSDDVSPGAYYVFTGVSCIHEQGNKSSCVFLPSMSDDGKTVTCQATNTLVHSISTNSTYMIDLIYPPSSQPSITGYTKETSLTEGDTVHLVCTILGGKPVVSSVMFSCNRRPDDHGIISSDQTSSVSSTLSFKAYVSVDNGTSCTYSGNWSRDPSLYQLTNKVTLYLAAAERPRITCLTLNDVEGDLTVNSSIRIVARCSAATLPQPTISVVRADTGFTLERDNGSDPTALGAANFTLTSSASCQDAAIYTCRARSTAGRDERNRTLLVNCAPTVDDEHSNSSSHPFNISASTELVLSLVAYPSPQDNVAAFLGESVSLEALPPIGIKSNAIRVTCQRNQDVIYKSLCTISITDKDDTKSGYYMVTLRNPFGSVNIYVYVVLGPQKTDAADESKDLPIAAIAGGAAAAVVGVIVIVLIIVIIKRKRQKPAGSAGKSITNQENNDELEEHINTMYGTSDPSEETPAPKPAAAKPVAVAWRISAGSYLNSESCTDDVASEDRVADDRYSSVSFKRPQQVLRIPDASRLNIAPSAHRAKEDTDDLSAAQASESDYQDLDGQDDRYEVVDDEEGKRCKSETTHADAYAVVDKSQKKMRGAVSSPNLGDSHVSMQGADGDVYAQVVKPSKKRDLGMESIQQKQKGDGGDANKPCVKPKPAAKPNPAVKPKPSRIQSAARCSAVEAESSVYVPNTVEAAQIDDSTAPSSRQNHAQNGRRSVDAEDEYNTLNLMDPHAARRNESDPDYSHIGSI